MTAEEFAAFVIRVDALDRRVREHTRRVELEIAKLRDELAPDFTLVQEPPPCPASSSPT